MARYIDLDKLLNGLEDELKDKNPNDIAYLVFKLFIGRLSKEPIADVVPKSEVEKIFEELHQKRNELWNKGNYTMFECWCKAEEEVKKKYTEDKNNDTD